MTDAELESAITKAGRNRVFAHAASMGWTGDQAPPKYVWWSIVFMIMAETPREPVDASGENPPASGKAKD